MTVIVNSIKDYISDSKKFYYQLIKIYEKFQEMVKRCSQPSSSSATAPDVSSMMTTMIPRHHFTTHSPRLLNNQAEKPEETVSRTARVPPPKLLPSTVRYANIQLPIQVGKNRNFTS